MTTKKTSWKNWMPGLATDHLTLAQVYETLPGNPPGDIHWLVKLVENPKSHMHLHGAAYLFEHDCIHIILGRGLLPQDEAFVIGFTMGADRKVHHWEKGLFKFISGKLYPKIYRFNQRQLAIFNLAFEFAHASECRDIHAFPFKDHMNTSLGELRRMLRIDKRWLESTYRAEQALAPGTKESLRLLPDSEKAHIVPREQPSSHLVLDTAL